MDNQNINSSQIEGKDFGEDALYVVDLLRICIEKRGFTEEVRLEIDRFYETSYESKDRTIVKKISSVYMAFLGKTDFKNIDSEKNDKLLNGLLQDLDEIEEAIEQL